MSWYFDLKSCTLCDFPFEKKEKYKMFILESQMYFILSVSSWFNFKYECCMPVNTIGDLFIYSKCDFHVDDENCKW
jgi:hypothetical protein